MTKASHIDANTEIEVLGLSSRAFNCLRRGRKNTIGDLQNTTPSELMRIRGMGGKTANEIEMRMLANRLYLKPETE